MTTWSQMFLQYKNSQCLIQRSPGQQPRVCVCVYFLQQSFLLADCLLNSFTCFSSKFETLIGILFSLVDSCVQLSFIVYFQIALEFIFSIEFLFHCETFHLYKENGQLVSKILCSNQFKIQLDFIAALLGAQSF